MKSPIRHSPLLFPALALACVLPLAVTACSGPPEPEEDAAVAEPSAEPATEEAPPEPDAEPADDDANGDLERREAELVAAEEELSRREGLSRREAEVAAREAELARRERASAASPPPAAEPSTPPEPESTPVAAEPEPAPVRELVDVTVPQGTLLDVEFLDTVSSATSQVGQTFTTRVAHDVVVDGLVAVPAGSRVIGVVTEAVPLKRIGGRARLGVELDRLVLPDGTERQIAAGFAEVGRSETGKDAATIGGAAAAGAILGRATASRDDRKKATVIGSILGAAAGTVIASRTEGDEITIPEGTFVTLALDAPVALTAQR